MHIYVLIKSVFIIRIDIQYLDVVVFTVVLSGIGSAVPADGWSSSANPLGRRHELSPLRV